MSATLLLAEIEALGARIERTDAGGLRVRNHGALDEGIRDEIRRFKDALLELLDAAPRAPQRPESEVFPMLQKWRALGVVSLSIGIVTHQGESGPEKWRALFYEFAPGEFSLEKVKELGADGHALRAEIEAGGRIENAALAHTHKEAHSAISRPEMIAGAKPHDVRNSAPAN